MFCRENAFLVDLGDINSFEVRAKFLAVLFLEAVPRLKFKFDVFFLLITLFVYLIQSWNLTSPSLGCDKGQVDITIVN